MISKLIAKLRKKFKGKSGSRREVKKKMTTYVYNGRRYYTTKREALRARRKGDRIYYDAFEEAYYIVRPSSKKSFWGW